MNLTTYPAEYLRCRAFGHRWSTQGAFLEQNNGVREIVQRWHCSCGCMAKDRYTTRLIRFGQRGYSHPDGYSPTPSQLDARIEWFRRFPPGDGEPPTW